MDFLDPQKQKAHTRRLAFGYALLGILLLLATVVLLYQAYGFGLDKNGRVIQNGFVFLSSRPQGADVYVNGKKAPSATNTRLQLPAGGYTVELKRDGYRTWKRGLTVEGGSVARYDYPFLFPTKLTTTTVKQYTAGVGLSTQSLDRRWLIMQAGAQDQFDLFDLNADEPVAKPLTIPTEILTPTSTTTGWQEVQWSDDNRHVVLKRTYQKAGTAGSEYLLFDRQDPTLSQNLTTVLGFNPTTIELRDQNYDQYYLYDQNATQLFTATLKKPTPQPFLKNVLAFSSHKDRLAYITSDGAPAGKVVVNVVEDEKTYTVRQLPLGQQYVLDMAEYSDSWYVAAGVQNEGRVYVYKDVVPALQEEPGTPLVPVQILKVASPKYVAFSPNSRIVLAENGEQFAVYDAETDRGYTYQSKVVMDVPQSRAVWIDSLHLGVVSGGQVAVFDFDGANLQRLSATSPAFAPIFNRDYNVLYTISAQNALTSTSLLTTQDQ